jgi:hypothetical protein
MGTAATESATPAPVETTAAPAASETPAPLPPIAPPSGASATEVPPAPAAAEITSAPLAEGAASTAPLPEAASAETETALPAILPPIAPTSSTPAAMETTPPSASTSEATTASPAVTTTGLELPELTQQQIEQAAGALDELFANTPNALAGLQSYRYNTVFAFVGEMDGEPESGSIEMSGAVAGPDRQTATWKDLESGEEFGILRVGEEAWMQDGEEWTSIPTAVADLMSQVVLVFAPSASWEGLADNVGASSTYVGTETVNGVVARHYTSTSSDWAQEWEDEVEIEDASGDVWIAEAGYPVRYRFAATGIDSEGYRGSIVWTMELTDVNGSVVIEAPQPSADSGE